MAEITNYLRQEIANGILATQDLGEQSRINAIEDMIDKVPYRDDFDFVTGYVVKSVNEATDVDDIESDLNYAINQLTRAKEQIQQYK